ncbi:MAG: hypothetical protein RL199_278, partial [Pseudomonadota bacterium]
CEACSSFSSCGCSDGQFYANGSCNTCPNGGMQGSCNCDYPQSWNGSACGCLDDSCCVYSNGGSYDYHYSPSSGSCEYCGGPGYSWDSATYSCVYDSCYMVSCNSNQSCSNGSCYCNEGYVSDGAGYCVSNDPCANVWCDSGTHCDNGSCVCDSGLVPHPTNTSPLQCVDACSTMSCGTNASCSGGSCYCPSGTYGNAADTAGPGCQPCKAWEKDTGSECLQMRFDSCAGRCDGPYFSYYPNSYYFSWGGYDVGALSASLSYLQNSYSDSFTVGGGISSICRNGEVVSDGIWGGSFMAANNYGSGVTYSWMYYEGSTAYGGSESTAPVSSWWCP